TNADNNTVSTSFGVSFTDVNPTVKALASTAVTAPENVPATNSGSFADYDDTLTIKADKGALTDNGDGTWTWSGTGDESSPYTVLLTATNADGNTVSTAFDVSFTDVAPTVKALASTAVTAPENTAATNSGSFTDYDDALTITADKGTLTGHG